LDTSALLALCLNEPGDSEVQTILEAGEGWVAAVSWLELRIKLEHVVNGHETVILYESLAGTVDVTREIAEAAYEIRRATRPRVPMIDSLIAGAARVHGMRLLHRDAHFAAIPAKLLKQKMLPAKR
jgi:predicted nucleic acid-binding protein